jgi:L-rhamnose mutarotase
MPEIALHTQLQPGRELDYETVHETIPSDVAAALAENGVREWRIWRDGTHLFHLIDVEDYPGMLHALEDHPANVRWQATVSPMQQRSEDSGAMPLLWSLVEQLSREEG